MPRLKRGLRSEAIREYVVANPKDGPAEIVEAMKKQGIKVTRGLASNVKYGGNRRKQKKRTMHSAARRTKKGSLTVEQLLEVKRLSESLGGLDRVQLALDALERFR
jgi:hypothetical protein